MNTAETNRRCLRWSVTHPWQRRTSGTSAAPGTARGAPSRTGTIGPLGLKTEGWGGQEGPNVKQHVQKWRLESSSYFRSCFIAVKRRATSTVAQKWFRGICCGNTASREIKLNLSAAGRQLLIFRVTSCCNSSPGQRWEDFQEKDDACKKRKAFFF